MININDFINHIKLKPIYKSEWESNSMYEEDIGVPFTMDDLTGIRPSVFIEKEQEYLKHLKVTRLIVMWIKNIIDIVVGIIAFMLCYGVLNQLICRFHQSDILTYVIIIALCIYSIDTSIIHIVKRVNTYRKNVHNNKPYLSYAVDFDGTLCDSEYPNFGKANKRLIKFLIKKKKEGHKVTLWTCREGTELLNAVKWCEKHGLTFDAVNENLPEDIEVFGSDPRKIGYDILIDDKIDIYKSIWLPFKGDIFD